MSKVNIDYIVKDKNSDQPIIIEEAYLSNDKDYTIFRYLDYVIRFQSPYSLEKYIEIKEWDKGYLVVLAKYAHNDKPEEEYIDLMPILEKLYFDADEFVDKIKKVSVKYE